MKDRSLFDMFKDRREIGEYWGERIKPAAEKERKMCVAVGPNGFSCTRKTGHARPHVAHGIGYVCAVWESD